MTLTPQQLVELLPAVFAVAVFVPFLLLAVLHATRRR